MRSGAVSAADAMAWLGGRLATGLVDLTTDPAALDSTGFWAVVATFEGAVMCARFTDVRSASPPPARWQGPAPDVWTSSMDEAGYRAGVAAIRARIAAGDVYQANLCRVLSAPLDAAADLSGLAQVLARGNPAPYAAYVRVPQAGIDVCSASPELYLSRTDGVVESKPIKGTAASAAEMLAKDHAENVMIVDLVRNDLGRVARTGSVDVPALCEVEEHPGLVHLVSTVRARLRDGATWADLLAATFPPGSVSGAPKSSALRIIAELEPVPRGPYCGAVGWIDADRGDGALAVGIRTFWRDRGWLRFGTGAGITWGSDPAAEWAETQLKAARLIGLASAAAPVGAL